MAARAVLEAEARDTAGNVQAGVSVYVFEADGVTPLAQTMYSTVAGSTTLTNPLTSDTSGRVQAYVATGQRCVLRVDLSGPVVTSEFQPDPGDLSASIVTAQTALVALATLLSAQGDLPYASSAGVPARLPIGTTRQLLSAIAGVPTWRNDPTVGRNLLVNGTGRTQQRTTLPTTDNAYGFDRARLLMENANGFTLAQETANLPAPGPGYGMKHIVGSGVNGKGGYFQPILFSNMRGLAGDAVSLQAKIYATAGIANMRMGVLQWTGTADNGGTTFPDPITTWQADGTNPTPSGSWAFAVAPTNLGAIAAWTASPYKVENVPISSSATNLAVLVWCDDRTTTQTTDYFIVTDLQLERGAYCTDFERVNVTLEKDMCMDWLISLDSAGVAASFGMGVANATNGGLATIPYPHAMRANPVPSYAAAAKYQVYDGLTATVLSAITTATATKTALRIGWTVAGTPYLVKAPVELLGVDAASIILLSAEP